MDTLDKITTLLTEQNKSQKALTDYLGLKKNAFTNWKSGHTTSYTKYLPQIAEFLDVSVDYLVGKTDKKNKTAQEGQPLTDEEKAILKKCEQLSVEDLHKVLEYVELLKLKRNSENESKETIRLVARSGDQKEITKSKKEFEEISAQLKEDTTSDY